MKRTRQLKKSKNGIRTFRLALWLGRKYINLMELYNAPKRMFCNNADGILGNVLISTELHDPVVVEYYVS